MERIAEFKKVTMGRWKDDLIKTLEKNGMKLASDFDKLSYAIDTYDELTIPRRATKGSAGYDFVSPFDITLAAGESVLVPTGMRCFIDNGWVLMLYPRSGLGFKYRVQLDNTTGIIDSDYSNSDNEGHIFAKITNDSKEGKTVRVAKGDAFIQGVFVPYGITRNDDTDTARNGGFGSTDRRKAQ